MPQAKACLMAAAALFASGAAGQEIDALLGDWRTVRHGAQVTISDCGDGSPCGFLVAVDPAVRDGRTRDLKNPDPDQRDRPLEGLPILWGHAFEDGRWRGGRLYNPETGQTFRSTMERVGPDALRVTGCWGLFCRTQTWARIAGDDPTTGKGDKQ